MARDLIASDNFNRASLDSDWAQTNPLEGSIQINASTDIYGPNALGDSQRQSARWVGAGTFTDDQYSSLKITVLGWVTTDYGIGVIARASADTDSNRDHYQVFVCADSNTGSFTTNFGKVVNGTYTSFHSASAAWAVNDLIEIECEGTTIRAMKNGVALGGSFTVTDSALSTGAPGVCGAGGSSVARGDDWAGGNLSAGSSNAPRAMHQRQIY